MSKITESQLQDLTDTVVQALEHAEVDVDGAGLVSLFSGVMAKAHKGMITTISKSICDQVDKHTRTAIDKMPPLRIQVNDLPSREWGEVTHPKFPDVVAALKAGMNVMLIGPAGSGKSYIAAQAAKALGQPFRGYVSVTNGTSESAFLGQLLPNEEGGFTYWGTPFVSAAQDGGIVCVDEVDAGDGNTLLVLNAVLNRDPLFVPKRFRDPIQQIHKDMGIVATANTFGLGSDRVYAGRNQLDGAFLNRWLQIEVDYDPKLETMFCPDKDLRAKFWEIRKAIAQHKLRRFVTGRTLSRAYALRHACGWDDTKIFQEATLGWTKDELKLVGV